MQLAELYEIYRRYPQVETDSRKLLPDSLFFALKGPQFNGNLFAREALDKGAAFVVVDEDPGFADDRLIRVSDSLQTLQDLARHHRLQFNIPFLAITGSNGKTTTKELIHAVLSSTYRTYTTQGNLNNHIGIPLTLLRIKDDAQMAVIEMGANHQREIAGYCGYALPSHGLITNIGKAHLEGFGGIEGVLKGKGELFEFLREQGGSAFVMWDDERLRRKSEGIREIVRYGTSDADYEARVISSEPFLSIEVLKGIEPTQLSTQLVGAYNFFNVLAAVAVGDHFKVPANEIRWAIEGYTPSNNRSQLVKRGSNTIILDAYNANPSSMRLAIENLGRIQAANKMLVIGGMMELGDESLIEHEAIRDLIASLDWKEVILVGGDFARIQHPYRFFIDSLQALEWLKVNPVMDSTILIKGSRSTQMEKVLDAFEV